jgi:ubiquinone biosynthesis protein
LIGDRKDVVPLHIVREMEKLQDNVPFFPAEQAINIIETSLKQPIDSLFYDLTKYQMPLLLCHRCTEPYCPQEGL